MDARHVGAGSPGFAEGTHAARSPRSLFHAPRSPSRRWPLRRSRSPPAPSRASGASTCIDRIGPRRGRDARRRRARIGRSSCRRSRRLVLGEPPAAGQLPLGARLRRAARICGGRFRHLASHRRRRARTGPASAPASRRRSSPESRSSTQSTVIVGGGCALRRSNDAGQSFSTAPVDPRRTAAVRAKIASFHFPSGPSRLPAYQGRKRLSHRRRRADLLAPDVRSGNVERRWQTVRPPTSSLPPTSTGSRSTGGGAGNDLQDDGFPAILGPMSPAPPHEG